LLDEELPLYSHAKILEHFSHIRELDWIKVEVSVSLCVGVVDFNVAAIKPVLFNLFCKMQQLILVNIVFVERPRGPDGIAEG
uniref:Uncharacterized protein n=1 Tax=Pelodiscus sinensis TaxID=13735 RepID=K7G0M3_PELSI